MLDEFHEECGVFGISQHHNAAFNCMLGLHALQHRGQESFGVTSSADGQVYSYHSGGQVSSVFDNVNEVTRSLPGIYAIGHVRYSTSGSKSGSQPMSRSSRFGDFAIAHNGNLLNTQELSERLKKEGCVLTSDIDTELILHLTIISIKNNFIESLVDALKQVHGAYSIVAVNKDTVIGVRDPAGIRPLVLGRLGNSYVLASETCALDIINANLIREVEAGEMIIIDKNGTLTREFPFAKQRSTFCIFEYVYFSRPDSIMKNKSIYSIRKDIGEMLAKESPPDRDAEMVIPIPDSGIPAAIGYAKQSGLPIEYGIIRNHYIGRTFIQPTAEVRKVRVQLKYNANKHILKNRNIILIDDSIVRGSTLKNVISMLRAAGVNKIHLKISSPPVRHSCFYGIDTPIRKDLIATNFSVERMQEIIGVESLYFLSIDGLYYAIKGIKRNNEAPQYCDACFTGNYPIGQ
ncbi:amidophosphoribosyltransferase [Wolbachia endosymbiont of Pentidionis agamae]|uniref:amidophosphoribosyltransferase n=1 Tax=Wolbachia endosymbiont of Pentidionis agamae TaxID=3110435 RepID=UPI002FD38F4D